MKPLCLSSCTLVFIFYTVSLSTSLKCGTDRFPLISGECIEFINTPLGNLDAHLQCQDNGDTGLLTLPSSTTYEHIQRYIAILGDDGVDYWLGYNGTSGGIVEPRDGHSLQSGSPTSNSSNFGQQDLGVPDGTPNCLTIRKDGLFYRRLCNESLPYICLRRLQAPQILNLTLSAPSRFITTTDPVTLTCTHVNGETTLWRRNGVQLESSNIARPSDNELTLTIDTSDNFAGQYDCVVSNGLGTVVSEVVELVNSVGTSLEAPEISSLTIDRVFSVFGVRTNISCSYDGSSTTVEWFINGVLVNTNNPNFEVITGSTSSLLIVESLLEEGVYQCRVFNANGDNSVESAVVNAEPGRPSPMDTIIALPNNRSSISIQWLPPLAINTYHHLLLRYNLQYGVIGESNTASMNNLLPVLSNGSVSSSGLSGIVINDVTAGTVYVVTMSAYTPNFNPSESVVEAHVVTYGDIPDETVKQVTANHTPDNKTIVVMWEPLATTFPIGRVERYEMQYRIQGKEFINTIRVNARFNYFVIVDIDQDATDYEVRVRAGVRVSRDPVVFEFNAFTNWEPVKGVTTKVPSVIPPTEVNLNNRPARIAAITVPVICVTVLIALILVVGIIFLVVRSRERPQGQRLKSESESETKAVNMSALRGDENVIVELEKQPF